MEPRLDAVVVGAGVVGLAVARALALAGREVVVIEAERSMGQHASSRNSEVLHAGIYYPPGSLKARLCVAGRRALVEYCRRHGVAHRLVGKIIVATRPHHRATLAQLRARARANGVGDLRILDAADVTAMEPQVRAVAGLWSPVTGIIDGHALMRALWADAERHGAMMALDTPVVAARPDDGGLVVEAGDLTLRCALLVNAAGLGAPGVAAAIRGLPAGAVPVARLCKGSYFSLRGMSFSHLVYPVPDTASLGIHVTLDLGGGVRVGPDQQWVDRVDYAVDPDRAPVFAAAVSEYVPTLDPAVLAPDYAGLRAKIHGPGRRPPDFVIAGPAEHGIAGLCNLLGIESPGLTACLAIAQQVLRTLGIEPSADEP